MSSGVVVWLAAAVKVTMRHREVLAMSGKVRNFFLLVLIGLASIELVLAQSDQLCGRERNVDDFVGAYTVEIGSALLTGDGKTITLKAAHTFQAIMSAIDGQLALDADTYTVPFRIAGENEPDWYFDLVADLSMDSADFEILVGCPISDLPRLIGQGVSKSAEGTPIEFTYRLIGYTVDRSEGISSMVGSLKWSGGGVAMSRIVRLSRN
jgi:hypothetical protein